MLLLVGLVACQSEQATPTTVTDGGATTPPKVVPVSTIPPGFGENDIRGPDSEAVRAIEQINRENPGFSCAIRGTYAEQVPGTFNAFRVEEGAPFIGRFDLRNGTSQAHTFAIACIVDQQQSPCTPGAPLVQLMTLDADQKIQLPLEIFGLSRGLHDFSVTFWHEPFAEQFDLFSASRVRVSLFMGGDTQPPISVTFADPGGQPPHGLGWVHISPERDLLNADGSIKPKVHMVVSAGELFDLYIHLNNRNDVDVEMALTAFVNYEQVAVHQNGEAYMPLYVLNHSQTWQPVAVQVRAPDEPGRYEFVVIGTAFPFARLDLNTHYGLNSPIGNAHSSYRILLEVK